MHHRTVHTLQPPTHMQAMPLARIVIERVSLHTVSHARTLSHLHTNNPYKHRPTLSPASRQTPQGSSRPCSSSRPARCCRPQTCSCRGTPCIPETCCQHKSCSPMRRARTRIPRCTARCVPAVSTTARISMHPHHAHLLTLTGHRSIFRTRWFVRSAISIVLPSGDTAGWAGLLKRASEPLPSA